MGRRGSRAQVPFDAAECESAPTPPRRRIAHVQQPARADRRSGRDLPLLLRRRGVRRAGRLPGRRVAGTRPGLLGVALAHGLALAVLVSALGAVSGAHFNPAVTLAVWIMGKITPTRAAAYVVAQLVGALGAGFALKAVFPDAWQASNIGSPALGPGITPAIGIGDRGGAHRPARLRGDRHGGRPPRPRRSAAWRSGWRWRPTS